MAITREPIRCKLEMERKMIEQIMPFNCLRASMTSARNSNQEMKE